MSKILLRLCHTISLLLSILLANFLTSATTFAISSTTYFQDYTVDYYLSRDSDDVSHLHVEENFTVIFPNSSTEHGIIRTIPFTNQAGENLTVRDQASLNFSVLRNGQSEPFSLTQSHNVKEGYFTAKIGSAARTVQGEQHYLLSYDFYNVITDFSDHQELYWDTNGTGWDKKFQNVTARLHIEDITLREQLLNQNWCYVGTYGSDDQSRCTTIPITDGIEFTTSNLAPYENLTLDVDFLPGTFTIVAIPNISDVADSSSSDFYITTQPSYANAKYYPFLVLLAEIIYCAVIFCICKFSGVKVVRSPDAKSATNILPQYLPPKNLTVAEADLCYQRGRKYNSQVATLIELAVAKKIELIHDASVWKIRIKALDMQSWQMSTLRIFKDNDAPFQINEELIIRTPSRFFNKSLRKTLDRYVVQLNSKVESKHLLKIRPAINTLRQVIIIFGTFFLMIPAITFISAVFDNTTVDGELFGQLAFIGSFVMLFFVTLCATGYHGTKITILKDGQELNDYLDGLKLYIEMAEQERLKFLQSVDGVDTTPEGIVKLHEKLLPYAIIFGQMASWTKLLGQYYQSSNLATPSWVLNMNHNDSFSSSLHAISLVSSAVTTSVSMTKFSLPSGSSSDSSSGSSHSSSSSSSSGSGGSGHSGGGGGGGGGSTW